MESEEVKLKNEIKDLLNQIVLKLSSVPKVEVRWKSYDNDDNSNSGSSNDGKYMIENIPDTNRDLQFLASVKDYCVETLKREHSAIEHTESYYDSTCWNY